MPRWDLRPLLAPRSIAIVGASESPDSWAPEIERSLRHVGFEGDLYPVNPKYDRVWGRPCSASVRALPSGIDLVVFVVPARVVVGMIDDCAARDVRGIMVVSSGFAEAGEEGRALQEELRAAALAHRIPVLGPNVEGFVNYLDHIAPYGTTPPAHPVAGPISVISQSGTVAWAMNQMASDRGVGLRIIVGVGNEAVLGLGDLYRWAAEDPATRVVASYIETMRDVESIGAGLDALRAANKPVLICAPKGTSEAARRSIVAHTGALAGDTALRDAWLLGHGAVLVQDPVTMFEAAVLCSHVKKLRTTGVAAALQSGGACTLFAEAAGDAGLALPELAPATRRSLRNVLPSFASQNNPLDVTGQAAVETDDVRGSVGGAGDRSRRRVGGVRRVPATVAGRGALGRRRLDEGGRSAASDRRGVRQRGHEPARIHPGSGRVHETMEAAGLPAGTPGLRGGDPGAGRSPVGEVSRRRRASATCGARGSPPDTARAQRSGGRGQSGDRVGTLRRAASQGDDRRLTGRRRRGRHPHRVPRRDQGAGAGDPTQGPARRGSPGDRDRRRRPAGSRGRAGSRQTRRRGAARRSWCNRW